MSAWTPEAVELSRELAIELGQIPGPRAAEPRGSSERRVMEAKVFTQDKEGIKIHWTVEHENVDGLTAAVDRLLGWLEVNEFYADHGFGNGSGSGAARSAPTKVAGVPQCRFCDGDVWDNRDDKRNAKSPDYKCKKKSCGAAAWIKEDGELNWQKG